MAIKISECRGVLCGVNSSFLGMKLEFCAE